MIYNQINKSKLHLTLPIQISKMDQEINNQNYSNDYYELREIKNSKPKTSRWHELFGFNQNSKIAKNMYKHSTLLPPPQKIQEEKHKMYKKSINDSKLKLRAIFRRLLMNNRQTAITYTRNPNYNDEIIFMNEQQCYAFVTQFESEAQVKFKRLKSQALMWYKEYDYLKMQEVLTKLEAWVDRVEDKSKQKFQEEARKYQNLKQMYENQQICQRYLADCQTSDIQRQTDINSTVFSMRPLEMEITKILDEGEQEREAQEAYVREIHAREAQARQAQARQGYFRQIHAIQAQAKEEKSRTEQIIEALTKQAKESKEPRKKNTHSSHRFC